MKLNRLMSKVVVALIGALCLASPAHAGSQLLPGISTGLPMGASLPPGIYSITLANYGWRGDQPNVGLGIPTWLIWSTPWTIAGGRFVLDTVTAVATVHVKDYKNFTGLSNPLLEAQLKWDLGHGLSMGVQSGVYFPMNNSLTPLGVARNFYSFMEVAAVTYELGDWEFDVTGVYGTGRNGTELGVNAGTQWVNYDFTTFRRIGKWEIGAVAFGSNDLSSPVTDYERQSQFAVGALVGYQIGPTTLQLKLTRDVSETGYGERETRLWANWIVPVSALLK